MVFAAVAATPAQAADTGPSPPSSDWPSASGVNVTPPPTPTAPSPPAGSGQLTPTSQSNTATNTQTTSTTGGNGGTATGGNAGPSQGGSRGGNAYANGGKAESHSSLQNEQSNLVSGHRGSSSGGGAVDNNPGSRDKFVLENTKPGKSRRAAARTRHARSPQPLGSAPADRDIQQVVKERRGHETEQVSPPAHGLPGHAPLPDQNPFFNLLGGASGSGAGLVLVLLAVLGASIALPSQRSKALRTRAAVWRPLAYVPPIELPG
jgi:hypothetical protein